MSVSAFLILTLTLSLSPPLWLTLTTNNNNSLKLVIVMWMWLFLFIKGVMCNVAVCSPILRLSIVDGALIHSATYAARALRRFSKTVASAPVYLLWRGRTVYALKRSGRLVLGGASNLDIRRAASSLIAFQSFSVV